MNQDLRKTIIRRQRPKADFDSGHLSDSTEDFIQSLYAARGLKTQADCSRRVSALPAPNFKDQDKALALLCDVFENHKSLMIVGDFDADGATSTALAKTALQAMGLEQVNYLVPNRFEFGYGLTEKIVDLALSQTPKPDVIMTVDNGISSIEGVAYANQHGLQVLVTDHHLPGDQLPKAAAIINPNQHGCTFPCNSLAGVGVVFYLLLALRKKLTETGWFNESKPAPNLSDWLDLVALGTVADLVPLVPTNRILVHQGILRIRKGQTRPGIIALCEVSGVKLDQINSTDFGFRLGPRINAAGRLEDMSIGIECLTCEDPKQALEYAKQLYSLNESRKSIEQDMKAQAQASVEQAKKRLGQTLPPAIVLFDPSWHQGVVGIVASRIKELFHRPVICFAKAKDDPNCTELKGSGRSVAGCHLRDMLDLTAKQSPQAVQKFGGHAMAAGLSIELSQLEVFASSFTQIIDKHVPKHLLQATIETDGELKENQIQLTTAQAIVDAGPWGQAFPEPSFDNIFELVQQRLVGEKHLKATVRIPGTQACFDAILFNVDLHNWPNERVENIRLVYRLDINEYRGFTKVQLMGEYIEALTYKQTTQAMNTTQNSQNEPLLLTD